MNAHGSFLNMIILYGHSKTHIKMFLLLLIPALVNQKFLQGKKQNL